MASFNEYHLDPKQFPFLETLQENWQLIRDEFTRFRQKASEEELQFTLDVLGPKSKTIKTKGKSKYNAFGVLFQGMFIEEYIQVHQIQYPQYELEDVSRKALKLREKYFLGLSKVIEKTNSLDLSFSSWDLGLEEEDRATGLLRGDNLKSNPKSKIQNPKSIGNILRNVYFGTFLPGLDVKLHVNYNPHMNRGYLGLIVPEGDVAMKICHDKLYWHEGEFMILDHSYPHCPHNYTDRERTVLVVDFFKTDQPRAEAIAFEQKLVRERMQENPYSLGVFGKNDRAKEEDFIKYGLSHQLEWDKAL